MKAAAPAPKPRTRQHRNNGQARRSKAFMEHFTRKLRSARGGRSGALSRAFEAQRTKLEIDQRNSDGPLKHIPNRAERRGHRSQGMSAGRAAR